MATIWDYLLEKNLKSWNKKKIIEESKTHKGLKRKAKRFLQKLNFKEEEIYNELVIYHPDYPRKKFDTNVSFYRIDMAGINGRELIGIECGIVNAKKLKDLQEMFDKIFWIPYFAKNYIFELTRL